MKRKNIAFIIPITLLLAACSSNVPTSSSITSFPTSIPTSEVTSSTSESSSSSITSEESTIPPVVNNYYLPSGYTVLNNDSKEVMSKTEFSYDNDLLGYKETYISDDLKVITHYEYSDDFSSLYIEEEYYSIKSNEEKLNSKTKESYNFLPNGSYSGSRYEYDLDLKDYVLDYNFVRMFNEFGQKTLSYNQRENSDIPGTYYYSQYDTYEYDSLGYPLRFDYYDYDSTPEKNKYLYAYTEFVYDGDDRSHSVAHDYYLNDDKFEEDSYTEIDYVNEDGVLKSKEQIYYMDETKGNYNEFHYLDNWKLVHSYYGGMNERKSISFDELNRIQKYSYTEESISSDSYAYYSEENGLIYQTRNNYIYNEYKRDTIATYTYNLNKQLTIASGVTEESTEGSEVPATQNISTTVTYSELQNDELYEQMDYFVTILGIYADKELIRGL